MSSAATHPDTLARVLSIVAIVISAVSPALTWMIYRRSGARVSVAAQKMLRYQITYVDGPIYGDIVMITVRNRGTASIQVTNVFYEVRGRKGFVTLHPDGPNLPHLLEGLHEAIWAPGLATLIEGAQVAEKGPAEVRAGVVLANGKLRKSRWFNVEASHGDAASG
jgi:hypothetical protein